jgi:hypothetical protein
MPMPRLDTLPMRRLFHFLITRYVAPFSLLMRHAAFAARSETAIDASFSLFDIAAGDSHVSAPCHHAALSAARCRRAAFR